MALLDRFRSRPVWQHPEAAVRLEAVRGLGPEAAELLASIARSDADPAVRRAALRKLDDVSVLVQAARDDAEPAVREDVLAHLQRLAAEEARDAARAGRALEAIADARALAALARTARLEPVAVAALARVEDQRSLLALAKTAEHASVRLAALERVGDPAALAEVAAKCEHKDAALAALERIGEPDALRAIASHARHKAAARRARARLEALGGGPALLAPEEARTRAVETCRALEALAHSHDWERIAAALEAAEDSWATLGASPPEDLALRFATARAALQGRAEARERELAGERARAEERQRQGDLRSALCARVERLAGDDALARLEEAEREWGGLPPLEAEGAAQLQARFERAAAGCRERHSRWAADQTRRARLGELVAELEGVAGHDPFSEVKEKAGALRREWESVRAGDLLPQELETRAGAALARLVERDRHSREQRERAEQQNRDRLVALVDRAHGLAKAETAALRDVERALREIKAGLEHPGPLPARRDRDTLAERLKAARAALYPRLQELREAEEWKRWANVSVQEDLCARMEALVSAPDLDKAALELRELQGRWRQFKEARKEEAQGLWERFSAARDKVQTRVEEHLRQKAAFEEENLRRKLQLCEQAESLQASHDWLRTADALKALQAEWSSVGPAPQRHAKAVWDRFHGACNRFFTARKQDLEQRKRDWAENLQKKEALCEKAEALAQSSEWEQVAAEIKRLQVEWKSVGAVRKNKSDAVWQRFRQACDAFYERYKRRDDLASAASVAAREELCAELEALAPAGEAGEPQAPPAGLAASVSSVLQRWRQAPAVPPEPGQRLADRLHAARDRLLVAFPEAFRGTDLDPEQNHARREKLCAKVEALADSQRGAAGGTESLAERLREALAANAMGGKAVAESRWRAAAEEVDAAQAAWKRLGPVPGEAGRALAARFKKACDRFHARRPH